VGDGEEDGDPRLPSVKANKGLPREFGRMIVAGLLGLTLGTLISSSTDWMAVCSATPASVRDQGLTSLKF